MKQTFMNMETSLRDLISSRVDASDVHTHQPRKDFDEAELNELAASIRETGIIHLSP